MSVNTNFWDVAFPQGQPDEGEADEHTDPWSS